MKDIRNREGYRDGGRILLGSILCSLVVRCLRSLEDCVADRCLPYELQCCCLVKLRYLPVCSRQYTGRSGIGKGEPKTHDCARKGLPPD
jgi:hypothetical protein